MTSVDWPVASPRPERQAALADLEQTLAGGGSCAGGTSIERDLARALRGGDELQKDMAVAMHTQLRLRGGGIFDAARRAGGAVWRAASAPLASIGEATEAARVAANYAVDVRIAYEQIEARLAAGLAGGAARTPSGPRMSDADLAAFVRDELAPAVRAARGNELLTRGLDESARVARGDPALSRRLAELRQSADAGGETRAGFLSRAMTAMAGFVRRHRVAIAVVLLVATVWWFGGAGAALTGIRELVGSAVVKAQSASVYLRRLLATSASWVWETARTCMENMKCVFMHQMGCEAYALQQAERAKKLEEAKSWLNNGCFKGVGGTIGAAVTGSASMTSAVATGLGIASNPAGWVVGLGALASAGLSCVVAGKSESDAQVAGLEKEFSDKDAGYNSAVQQSLKYVKQFAPMVLDRIGGAESTGTVMALLGAAQTATSIRSKMIATDRAITGAKASAATGISETMHGVLDHALVSALPEGQRASAQTVLRGMKLARTAPGAVISAAADAVEDPEVAEFRARIERAGLLPEAEVVKPAKKKKKPVKKPAEKKPAEKKPVKKKPAKKKPVEKKQRSRPRAKKNRRREAAQEEAEE
ncbi:MAG: hypothetical protein VYE81_06645 [Planctomycetota bacterium]|nr:hypothetical protein [Planctomycetota bacterium]